MESMQKFIRELRGLATHVNTSDYGATGQYSCIYFNLYAAISVTTQGKSYNSAASLLLESFLNNNVPFGSMNELIEFIHNVITAKPSTDAKYEDLITIHASIDEVFFKLLSSTGWGWVPTEEEMLIIWDMLSKLSQFDLDRLFYKNNLFYFIDNEPVKQAILYILQQLKEPFMNPNEPPEYIIEPLNALRDAFKEYVYYDFQIIDRIEKMDSLIRSVSIIMDTDSVIVCFDGFYQYVKNMCFGVPMAIKNEVVDIMEFLDGRTVTRPPKQVISEYSFIDDREIINDRLIDPMEIIPQDGLRFSIINMLAYCLGYIINDYMEKYCHNSHSDGNGKCRIAMKNEFLMKRLLITSAKKHYASKMELQEGNRIPEEKSLDIKGMDAFVKSSTNPAIQEKLKKILYEDILNSDSVDPLVVLADIAKVEKEIYQSINSGEKRFFKPLKVKSISAYENPMRIQGIVASHAYNTLHEPGTESLDMSARNSVDIVKVDINMKNVDRIRDTHPYVFEKAVELLKTEEYKSGISAIAIPLNEPVPGWVLPFIEYDQIINDNISGFPIESIGLYRGAPTNNSTNIIQF